MRGASVWRAKDQLRADLSPAEIDARVHAICRYLRTDCDPCRNCARWEIEQRYGPVQRMCYGLAEEVLAIARAPSSSGRSGD